MTNPFKTLHFIVHKIQHKQVHIITVHGYVNFCIAKFAEMQIKNKEPPNLLFMVIGITPPTNYSLGLQQLIWFDYVIKIVLLVLLVLLVGPYIIVNMYNI